MGDHLGVRLTREFVTLRSEPRAKFFVIFNDPVVHDADRAVGEVRMGVRHFGRAVRRPTRVRDAGRGFELLSFDLRLQFRDARDGPGAAKAALGRHGDAAGVVTSVFEAAQPFEQYGNDVSTAHGRNDATHIRISFFR